MSFRRDNMVTDEMYMGIVNYAKHLENLLKLQSYVNDDVLRDMRKDYIKPVTNVAKDWLEGDDRI